MHSKYTVTQDAAMLAVTDSFSLSRSLIEVDPDPKDWPDFTVIGNTGVGA